METTEKEEIKKNTPEQEQLFDKHLTDKNWIKLEELSKAGFQLESKHQLKVDNSQGLSIDEKVAAKAIFFVEPPKETINEILKPSKSMEKGKSRDEVQEMGNQEKENKEPDKKLGQKMGHLADKAFGDM